MAEKKHTIPRVSLPRLIAYRPEPKQTPCDQKVPSIYCSISLLPIVPGNGSGGLFYFHTVIAACGGYNIRGGEVIVNLFFAARQVPEVESEPFVRQARCDYCLQLSQLFTYVELLENETNFEVSTARLPPTRKLKTNLLAIMAVQITFPRRQARLQLKGEEG